MKLTVLMDNHTEIDVYHLGEPAVSYWLEADGKRFLFDTGYSDAFLKNAKAMGIDLTTADAILLSHGHNDHTGGLPDLLALPFPKKPRLIAHPHALLPKALGNHGHRQSSVYERIAGKSRAGIYRSTPLAHRPPCFSGRNSTHCRL